MKTLFWIVLVCGLALAGCEAKQEAAPADKAAVKTENQEAAAAEGAGEAKAAEGSEAPATGEATAEEAKPGEADIVPAGETVHYGAAFSLATEPLKLADALSKLDEVVGTPLRVEANVKTSCRKKGCWMELEPVAADAEPVRVTFKDYGFFVPRHADGAAAVLEGQFVKDTMTEADRKHHAQDAAKSAEEIAAITGDVDVIKFVAVAVDLTGAVAIAEPAAAGEGTPEGEEAPATP